MHSSSIRVVTVDLANNAMHLSRLQVAPNFPDAYGGQVMASVSRISGKGAWMWAERDGCAKTRVLAKVDEVDMKT